MNLAVAVSPKKIALTLTLVALSLTLASAVSQFVQISLGLGNTGFLTMFFVERDDTIPEWFSSVILLFCSILLAVIARYTRIAGDRFVLHWWVLSAIFLYLSVDEGVSIHEKTSPLGRWMLEGIGLDPSGLIIRGWVVPGAILVLIFALAYLRFVVALPPEIRRLFILAGLLFVVGALGMEVLRDFHANLLGGARNMSLAQIAVRTAIAYVEEFLEMLGVIVFAYALLLYAGDRAGKT